MGLNRSLTTALSLFLAFSLPALAAPRSSAPAPAAARGHRHLVRIPVKDAASITGRVLDASTGVAVFQAVVSTQGYSATAGMDGSFTLDQLVPGSTTITVQRWGYANASSTVTLVTGSNPVNLTMQSNPALRLNDASGKSYSFDAATAHFAQEVLFVGYHTLDPLEVCLADGSHQDIATADMKSVTGTGATISNSVCCPDNASPELHFTLRTGAQVDAILELCKYYQIDFVGHDYANGTWHYTRSIDIRSITLP